MNKRTILEAFAKEELGYERTGQSLLCTLEVILSCINRSNRTLCTFQINQEDKTLGTPDVIRGLQAQLCSAGYIHRIIKNRGEFTSVAYVYNPHSFIHESDFYKVLPVGPEEILALCDRWAEGEIEKEPFQLPSEDLEFIY